MEDIEEPPTKVSKFDMSGEYLEGEAMEEGQEEWLSEGVLTDDDYAHAVEQDSCPEDALAGAEAPNHIEDTLHSLESNQQPEELPEELNAFLVRKAKPQERASDPEQSPRRSDDDGNDTDDLLRMLGDGDDKSKLRRDTNSSEDDDFVYDGAKLKTYKISKNVLLKPATKALPEDELTDASEDEGTVKAESTNSGASSQHKLVKQNTHVRMGPKPQLKEAQKNIKHYVSKTKGTSLLKQSEGDSNKEVATKRESRLKQDDTQDESGALPSPERMEEEAPTDTDSVSEDESLYDELPSSDSENLDEWFTLDIRAERAGDYLPLLGDKAYKLLSEEKQRVVSRVSTLQQSLTSLGEAARAQARQLRHAAQVAAELDARLRAA